MLGRVRYSPALIYIGERKRSTNTANSGVTNEQRKEPLVRPATVFSANFLIPLILIYMQIAKRSHTNTRNRTGAFTGVQATIGLHIYLDKYGWDVK